MITILNQVTGSLCNTKTDEIKWMDHLVSTKHLEVCKNVEKKIAIGFSEMISNACPKKFK